MRLLYVHYRSQKHFQKLTVSAFWRANDYKNYRFQIIERYSFKANALSSEF